MDVVGQLGTKLIDTYKGYPMEISKHSDTSSRQQHCAFRRPTLNSDIHLILHGEPALQGVVG